MESPRITTLSEILAHIGANGEECGPESLRFETQRLVHAKKASETIVSGRIRCIKCDRTWSEEHVLL